MAIERGIYIIRRDIIGIDNVFASGVTFEAPVIGLPFQDGDANVQRVCFLDTCRRVLQSKIMLQTHSGKCAALRMICILSPNLNSFPVHLEALP